MTEQTQFVKVTAKLLSCGFVTLSVPLIKELSSVNGLPRYKHPESIVDQKGRYYVKIPMLESSYIRYKEIPRPQQGWIDT